MNSKALVTAALEGVAVPRVPVGPLAVHFCARLAGYSLRQYSTSAGALAESVVRYYERFRPDAVWVSADTWVSAEAMGAKVGATDRGLLRPVPVLTGGGAHGDERNHAQSIG